MYSRIPDRFLQTEPADVPPEDEVVKEGGPAEPAPSHNPSRGQSAWARARSMSTALLSLKLLSSMQQGPPLGPLFPPLGPSSLTGSSSSLTPPGRARSVLHPDNQRVLALRGFYGDHLPEGLENLVDLHRRTGKEQESAGRKKSAEDRRKDFHKTRSKRHHSLVESGDEEGDAHSRDSYMKSVDFSTTTESTDSGGELSTSAPTTPGDVFLDGISLSRGPCLPGQRLPTMEELWLPASGVGGRPSGPDQLDVDSDGSRTVTPCPSRQTTMEKVATLTPSQGEGLEGELGGGGGGTGSRTSSTSTDPGRTGVSIVVSEDVKRQHLSPPHASPPPFSSGGGGRGGMNFLNIVHAAMDRMSDSGSEHTLVDHQSSSSGSPRPVTGSECPVLFPTADSPGDARGSSGPGVPASSESPVLTSARTSASSVSWASRQLETGPVLHVYHRKAAPAPTARDENDNLQHAFLKQGQNLHPYLGSRQGPEDLPRMSSVQSDSSGFVDTEVSNDNAVPDMASLKVSNLGSSCESSATMASTNTVVAANSGYSHGNSSYHQHTDTSTTQPTQRLLQDAPEDSKRRSRSADDILRSDSSGTGQRYITMCYIPNLNNASTNQVPMASLKNWLTTTTTRDGRRSPRGPTQISVVLREKARSDTAPVRREVTKKARSDTAPGRREVTKNELPLSEELALASGRQVPASSPRYVSPHGRTQFPASRYPGSQVTMTSVTRLALQRPTLDNSSAEGSRGSGDELERDERSLSYSSWSRELASSSSSRPRRSRPRYYPGTDEESGASVEGSSVYSCASTSDSVASGTSSDLLDCHKLLRLINQPTVLKGHKTRIVHYKPRRPLRDWPGLLKRKRLQEESRLAQYALHKFKTEMNMMETSAMGRYHLIFDDLGQEDRDDIEELQHLWGEVRHQLMETEQLLMSRMKSLASGNDSFNFLSSLHVLQRMIELLKEQLFQKQLGAEEEEEQQEEEEWEEERGGRYRAWGTRPRHSSLGSWGEVSRPRMRSRYASSTSNLPLTPAFSDPSYDQLRSSLVSELREEVRSNLHSLQQDLHKRDSEIHRLQLQLMLEGRSKRPRSTQQWSRSLPGSPRQRGVKETDV